MSSLLKSSSLFIFLFIYLLVPSNQINIVTQKTNDIESREVDHAYIQEYLSSLSNPNSKSIKALPQKRLIDLSCSRLLQTYQSLGSDSFSNYKYCKKDHLLLLGISDNIISSTKPFCYNSLSSIFCNNYLEYIEEKSKCINERLTEFVVDLIKKCAKSKGKTKNYVCDTLNIVTKKIEDSDIFCKHARTSTLIDSNTFNDKYEVIQIQDDLIPDCRAIVDKYNLCVESNDYLFLYDDKYEQCLDYRSAIYDGCMKLKYYSEEHKNMCKNYILPALASLSLDQNLFDENVGSICYDFKGTIMHLYNQYLFNIKIKKQNYDFYHQDSNNMMKNNTNITPRSYKILDLISENNKLWRKIFVFDEAKQKKFTVTSETEYDLFLKDYGRLFDYSEQLKTHSDIQNELMSNEVPMDNKVEKLTEILDIYINIEFTLINLNRGLKSFCGVYNGTCFYEFGESKAKEMDREYALIISNIKEFIDFGVKFSKMFGTDKFKELNKINVDIDKLNDYGMRLNKMRDSFIQFTREKK